MALSDEAMARAWDLAASLPPFTERQRDELTLLIRPYAVEANQGRRAARPRQMRRPPGGGA
jgi:hypothetical protein